MIYAFNQDTFHAQKAPLSTCWCSKIRRANVPDMPMWKTVMWPGTCAGIFVVVPCSSVTSKLKTGRMFCSGTLWFGWHHLW